MNLGHIYRHPLLYSLVYNSNMSVWASEAYGTSELINNLTVNLVRANLASIGTGQDLRLVNYLSDTLPYTFVIRSDSPKDAMLSMQHKCVISDSKFFATIKHFKYDVIFSSGFFLNSLTFKNKHPTLNHLTIALRNIAKHVKAGGSIVMSTHCPKRTLTNVTFTEDSIKVNKPYIRVGYDLPTSFVIKQKFRHELVEGRYQGSSSIELAARSYSITFDDPVLYTIWTGEDYIKAAIGAGLCVDFYRVDVIDSGFNTLHLSCADENEPFSHVTFTKL